MKTSLTAKALILLVTGALSASPAHALFHLMQIEQVIGGVNGDTSAQAIQLRMRSASQFVLAGAILRCWDAQGLNPIVLIDFNSNVVNDGRGVRVLIASPNFGDFTSPSVIPDFIMTNPIPADRLAAGSITFESDKGIISWRLSWGGAGYTGPHDGSTDNDVDGNFGPPWPGPLPSGSPNALLFQGSAAALSTNNAADYAVTLGAAVFTNNAGDSFTVIPDGPTGACCDDTTGSCVELVAQSSCDGAGFRYGGDDSTCLTIDPACEPPPPIGACCDEVLGVCTNDVDQDTCEDSGRRFGGEDSDCATISPPCRGSGACCEDSNGFCTDGVTESDCTSAGLRYGGNGSDCATLDPPCVAPPVVGSGARYLSITPPEGPNSVGIVVTPNCPAGVAKYVGTPGDPENTAVLVDNPLSGAFLTKAQWGGTVHVTDIDIVPNTSYAVQFDSGSPGSPVLSGAETATTALWGDSAGPFVAGAWTPPDGAFNVPDVIAIIQVFVGVDTAPPIFQADMQGAVDLCRPDRQVDIVDVLDAVAGFQGLNYALSMPECPRPCS